MPLPPTHPSRRIRALTHGVAAWLALSCVLATTSVLAVPAASAAQTEEPVLTLSLVSQPVWYGPGDKLNVRLRISNASESDIDSFRIRVGVYDRVRTRSDLENSFDAAPGLEPSVRPLDLTRKIAAGERVTIRLKEALGNFPTLAAATDGGVYPATFALQDASGVETFDSLTVPLIYYPTRPQNPLNMVLLLPLNTEPTRGPDGSFPESTTQPAPLEAASSESGWLTGYLDALEAALAPDEPERGRKRSRRPQPRPPLRVTIAPTPRLIEELADMRDGYRRGEDENLGPGSEESQAAARMLARLSSIVSSSDVETALVPYGFPDIPTLVDELPIEQTLQQLTVGATVLTKVLGVRSSNPWLFPPAGRLDEGSLERLQLAPGYGTKVFLSRTSVVQPSDPSTGGCPETSPSFTCPAAIRTSQDTSSALVADPGITQRLSLLQLRPQDRLTLQQVFAETSMIHEELPGVADRVISATIPSLWHPSPRLARTLLDGLRSAPWLQSMTPDEALAESQPAVDREIVAQAADIRNQPSTFFFDDIERAQETVDSYSSVVAEPGTSRLVRLRRNILVGQSRSWWRDIGAGASYINAAEDEATGEMRKISIAGSEGFTFTARRGQIQLIMLNGTEYPVSAVLRFISPNIELERNTITGTYEPGNKALAIDATARTSGNFPLVIRVESPDGNFLIDERRIVISSTSLNQIALTITLGALAFLVLFYLYRGIRRRRATESEA